MFMVPTWRCLSVLVMIVLSCAIPQNGRADGGSRLALVVGNHAYAAGALKNPGNDARDMAGKLRELGFEVVHVQNAGLKELLEATQDLVRRAPNYDVRLFYYAGHGLQYQGGTYLVPVDAVLKDKAEIATQTLRFDHLIERLSQVAGGINLYVLDACRDNPFAYALAVGRDGRQIKLRGPSPPFLGLARPKALNGGSLVAFSTAPGQISRDSPAERNSVYTRQLLRHIDSPGLTHEQLFRQVRKVVQDETQGEQVPWEHTSLVEPFCFRVRNGQPCGA